MAVTSGITGCAHPANEWTLRDKPVLHKGMDHRLMFACLVLHQHRLEAPPRETTLKYWQPVDEDAHTQFLQHTSDEKFLSTTLLILEASLYELAKDTPHRKGSAHQPDGSRVAKCPDHWESLPSPKRAFKTRRLRQKFAAQRRSAATLKRILKQNHATFVPTRLVINSRESCDRSEWLSSLHRFGLNRFTDIANTADRQKDRLNELIAEHLRQTTGDRDMNLPLEIWDFLQAEAKLLPGTGVGSDGIPPEVYRTLPMAAVIRIFHLFRRRAVF